MRIFQDFSCPRCNSGFVEELTSANRGSSNLLDDGHEDEYVSHLPKSYLNYMDTCIYNPLSVLFFAVYM